MNPYRELANAIILQAVKDYRRNKSEQSREEIERFFRSDWFGALTRINPEQLIAQLRKENK
ncbi:MAG: hypothetical protein MJ077_11265 [Oscillospiraceae bacterium]|nr:hypothetical protein [Oscillospiraceae bacterium]